MKQSIDYKRAKKRLNKLIFAISRSTDIDLCLLAHYTLKEVNKRGLIDEVNKIVTIEDKLS